MIILCWPLAVLLAGVGYFAGRLCDGVCDGAGVPAPWGIGIRTVTGGMTKLLPMSVMTTAFSINVPTLYSMLSMVAK